MIGSKAPSDFRTRSPIGQIEINQSDGRVLRMGEGCRHIPGDTDDFVAVVFQGVLQIERDEQFVFDDENAGGHGSYPYSPSHDRETGLALQQV